jgi:hypothetical protein
MFGFWGASSFSRDKTEAERELDQDLQRELGNHAGRWDLTGKLLNRDHLQITLQILRANATQNTFTRLRRTSRCAKHVAVVCVVTVPSVCDLTSLFDMISFRAGLEAQPAGRCTCHGVNQSWGIHRFRKFTRVCLWARIARTTVALSSFLSSPYASCAPQFISVFQSRYSGPL